MSQESKPHSFAPKATVHGLRSVLSAESETNPWLIEKFLARGDQMVISAPPKTGKSLLAQQIALALVLNHLPGTQSHYVFRENNYSELVDDDGLPKFKVLPRDDKPGARLKVLVFSLEMNRGAVASRLRRQMSGLGITELRAPLATTDSVLDWLGNVELLHVFGLDAQPAGPNGVSGELICDLQLVEQASSTSFGEKPEIRRGKHADAVQVAIQEHQPDMVIYDTLVQLHSMDENDNIQMKSLMRFLRSITQYQKRKSDFGFGKVGQPVKVAHIVVHHTRKENGSFRGPLSADMIRGAGSLQAVADTLVVARRAAGKGIEVNVTARAFEHPNFYLELEPNSLLLQLQAAAKPKTRSDIKTELIDKAIIDSLRDAPFGIGREFSLAGLILASKQNFKLQGLGGTAPKHRVTWRNKVETLVRDGQIELIPSPDGKKRHKSEWPEGYRYRAKILAGA